MAASGQRQLSESKLRTQKLQTQQEQAAERAEITAHYWQRLELTSQSNLPSVPMIVRIAKTLAIKPKQLFNE